VVRNIDARLLSAKPDLFGPEAEFSGIAYRELINSAQH
jgi:hypothetical protein